MSVQTGSAQLTVAPSGVLRGAYALSGDKSLSHRAALFAAIAEGESVIENFLVAGVTQAMLDALTALGVAWALDGTTLQVHSPGIRGWQAPLAPIDCGNSATTLRLLAGALAAAGIPAVLDGSPGLRRRPMGRIVAPLGKMGVPILASPEYTAPLVLLARRPGQRLLALEYDLPVASAQVKSCLLLAALASEGETVLREPGPSRDHSERMLAGWGIPVETSQIKAGSQTLYQTRLTAPLELKLPPIRGVLPGDISSAAFLIVAALIAPGSEITLPNVGLNPTRTGLLDALLAMGAQIEIKAETLRFGEPAGDLDVQASRLRATRIAGPLVVRMIDEFPAFAIAAAYAHGTTTVTGAEELRHKESDRISALCGELRALGIAARESPDGFTISGGLVAGGQAESHGDHRLAMALALAGLASQQPVQVSGAELLAESFPAFAEVLAGFGAKINLA
jgi:3-phosphoshikimate 1-carboxyvinyltransferase